MNAPKEPTPAGIVVVDKPAGCTSHDVVAWARRALRTREIGHAGTLDPAATGVLVLLVGEATKLSSFITAEDKSYEATLRFGAETDSLDADGAVTRTGPAEVDPALLREALHEMVGPMQQVPPAVSAIKVGGVASHERVRRGEEVALPAREVTLCDARVLAHEGSEASIAMTCSKGFYVRALARDLAARVGTVAHLCALRRTRSGCFGLDGSLAGETLRAAKSDDDARAAVRAALLPLEALEGRVPTMRVDLARARELRCGRVAEAPEGASEGVFLALLDRDELPPRAIGLARCEGNTLRAERNLSDASVADILGNTPRPQGLG